MLGFSAKITNFAHVEGAMRHLHAKPFGVYAPLLLANLENWQAKRASGRDATVGLLAFARRKRRSAARNAHGCGSISLFFSRCFPEPAGKGANAGPHFVRLNERSITANTAHIVQTTFQHYKPKHYSLCFHKNLTRLLRRP